MNTLGYSLLAVMLFLGSMVSSAQITELCSATNTCSVSRAVAPGIDATVTMTWRGVAVVERNTLVTSSGGRFLAGGSVLGTTSTVLQQRIMASAIGGPVNFSVSESLFISGAITQRAAALGVQQIQFERRFLLEGVTMAATQAIVLLPPAFNIRQSIPEGTEPGPTAVRITRIAQRFNTGNTIESISKDAAIYAEATIDYDGAGLIDAIWEVASPPSSSGDLIFRPLKNIRQYLVAGRQVVFQSPALPANETGIYNVRLRIIQPLIQQQNISLRYQVTSRALSTPTTPISVIKPAPSSFVDSGTQFGWRPVSGSRAYQLEIFDLDSIDLFAQSSSPLTGVLLRADQINSPLTTGVLNYLEPGKIYYWRVVAIGHGGDIIAASELRKVQMKK